MHGRHLALLALLALLAACPGPRVPGSGASCPEAARLLDEAAAARAGGHLFRALARAEAADRACSSERARRAVAELRAALEGRPEAPAAPAAPAPGDAAEVRAAAWLRLTGEPERALAKLRPLAARLDAVGLAELSRAEAANRHAVERTRATVCRAGACRELAIPELPRDPLADDEPPSAAVSDDGRLIAVATAPGDVDTRRPGRGVVYDVAAGRRIRMLELGAGIAELAFLGDTLLVTDTRCAGACVGSWLVEPRTGKRLGAVGGTDPLHTSERSAARVSGDVWAFDDDRAERVVYQDVRTGRVVGRFKRPPTCPPRAYCNERMLHIPAGLAILGEGPAAGRIVVMDARGKVVAQHRVPACAP
jgi:hypothetical protein